MRLHDHLDIAAPPTTVWAILEHPGRRERCNPKCVECSLDEAATARRGLRYTTSYRMGDRTRESRCEIVDCDPGRLIRTRHVIAGAKSDTYVEETLRLQTLPQGTRLRQQMDFGKSGLPWYAQLLLKLIDTIGTKVGKGALDGIKKAAEGQQTVGRWTVDGRR